MKTYSKEEEKRIASRYTEAIKSLGEEAVKEDATMFAIPEDHPWGGRLIVFDPGETDAVPQAAIAPTVEAELADIIITALTRADEAERRAMES